MPNAPKSVLFPPQAHFQIKIISYISIGLLGFSHMTSLLGKKT